MIKYLQYILVLVLVHSQVKGQDIHFSLFNEMPLNLNPAMTAVGETTMRAGLIYRNQWNSVTTPFQSSGVYGDIRLNTDIIPNDGIGVGILFLNDQSGTGSLQQNHFIANASYHKFIDNKQTMLVTGGLNLGFFQKGYDPNKLNFATDFAYESDNFISNGAFENLSVTSIVRPEIGLGGTFTKFDSKGYANTAGIAVAHLTTPNQSFSSYDDPLKIRTTIHGKMVKHFNNKFRAIPSAVFLYQNRAYNLIGGSEFIYRIGRALIEDTELKAGLYYRADDAVFFTFGINHDNWGINLGYDYTISRLNEATNMVNAFEIGISIRNKVYSSKGKRFILPGNRLL